MAINVEQNILIQNAEAVSAYHRSNSEFFAYRTFRQIDGNTHNIVDKLKGTPSVSIFREMKTSLLSLMQPTIRIFKVSYSKAVPEPGGTIDSPKVKMTPLTLPVYREFKFSNNFGFETALSPNEYLSFESDKATYRNVGLDGIKISHKGINYGEFQKEIYVNLSLVFKSLKDLAALMPGEPAPEDGGLRFLDLFTFSSQTKKTSLIQTLNARDNQIKFLIGWQAPSEEQLAGLNLSQREINNLKKIEAFSQLYSVFLRDYSFTIKQDGQVSFEIEYQSWIDSCLDTVDASVLRTTYKYSESEQKFVFDKNAKKLRLSEISDLETEISVLNTELQKPSASKQLQDKFKMRVENDNERYLYRKIMCVTEAGEDNGLYQPPRDGVIRDSDAFFAWFKNKRNTTKLKREIKRDAGILKDSIFKSFITELMQGHNFPYGSGSRLFIMRAPMGPIIDSIISDESIPEADRPTFDLGNLDLDSAPRIAKIDDFTVDAVQAETLEKITKRIQPIEPTLADISKRLVSGNNYYNFYFFYLGDIIELACRNAGVSEVGFDEDAAFNELPRVFSQFTNASEAADPIKYSRILLGPVEFINSKGGISRINLAEFPISYNTFSAWYLKNVVDKSDSTVSFVSFTKNLIKFVSDLLSKGLPENAKPPGVKSISQNFTLPGKQIPGRSLTLMGRTVNDFEELLPKKPIINIDSPDFNLNYYNKLRLGDVASTLGEGSIRTSYDYSLYHFTTISDIQERNGNPIEDDEANILHFSIGSDRGMLKQIKFTKIQDPSLSDILVERAKKTGNITEELAFFYIANPDLYGAPFILPGMVFYVNPTLTGLGLPEEVGSVASRLMLGGYFTVGDVEYTIRNSIFETRIKALYQAHGKERQ